MRVERPGFSVKAIETTGAGDTFCGSSLNYIVEHDFDNLTEEQLGEMLTFANAGSSACDHEKRRDQGDGKRKDVEELIRK